MIKNIALPFLFAIILSACSTQTTVISESGYIPTIAPDCSIDIEKKVLFDYDSVILNKDAQNILAAQFGFLKFNDSVNIQIQGHTDERGTREYNLALGERRAEAVRQYFLAQGIAPGRISIVSYGKERPAVVGSDESSWSQNRRAVTVIAR